jgi:hypothetical protein
VRRLESKAPARRRGHSEAWSPLSGDAGLGITTADAWLTAHIGTTFVYNVLQQVSHIPLEGVAASSRH